ncbi:MAG: DoxX family protein [Acidobacteria bacterium]|nr:DoxX family protein [Acidobacteriota bacterium]
MSPPTSVLSLSPKMAGRLNQRTRSCRYPVRRTSWCGASSRRWDVGLLGRVAAFGVLCKLVAISLVHLPNGLFMNWTGNQPGEGFEFHLLAIIAALDVMVRGSGAFSVDRALSTRGAVEIPVQQARARAA